MTFRPPPTPSTSRSRVTEDLIARKATDVDRWAVPANLATQWDERARLAAALIGPAPVRVLDVGAGAMTLQSVLPPGSQYTPADVVARREGCFVVDLNRRQFPPGQYDVISFLGVLEYIHDPRWALHKAAEAAPNLIVSYCTDISGDLAYRRGLGWVNEFTALQFETLLGEAGWAPEQRAPYKKHAANEQLLWRCVRSGA
jgi:hypothetical protein